MIWSLLLYVAMMLLINWDEVSHAINNKAGITVVEQPAAASPANISNRTNTLTTVAHLIRVITGIPSVNQ